MNTMNTMNTTAASAAMPQTLVCGSGRAGDQNYLERKEGAVGVKNYRRAATRSAGETLSVASRAYRPVGCRHSRQFANFGN